MKKTLSEWTPLIREADLKKKEGIDYKTFCEGKGISLGQFYGAKRRMRDAVNPKIISRDAKKKNFVEFAPVGTVTPLLEVYFHGATIMCSDERLPGMLKVIREINKEHAV